LALFLVVWKLFSWIGSTEKGTFWIVKRKDTKRGSNLARCGEEKRSSRSEEIEDQLSSTTTYNVFNL
jgi:hypothetical protein